MKYFNKKSAVLLMLLFIIAALFNLLVRNYEQYVIDPILSNVNKTYILDILFLFVWVFGVLITVRYIKSRRGIKFEYLVIATVIFIIYFYFRGSSNYYYTSLKSIKGIYYSDVFLTLGIVIIINIFYWTRKKELPTDNSIPFLVDIPLKGLSHPEQDVFGYIKFAKQLALKIQSKLPDPECGSLAIGIMGEWGSGKTSFIRFIRDHVDEKNRIFIDFYPWRSSSPENIIQDFFNLLISNLSSLDTRLSKNLSRYAEKLSDIDENPITKAVQNLSDFILGDGNYNEDYQLINDVIRKSKKQILIFIDDLDRLDKREIVEVLRLIRNTASFDNIVYIVGYDRGYIEEAIKEINTHKYQVYLEKIFQFELILPFIDPEQIRVNIKSVLKNYIKSPDIEIVNQALDLKIGGERYFTNEFLRNQRDVIRFANSFLFDFHFVIHEVHPKDFTLIHLIKWGFPRIYEEIRMNRFLFLTISEEVASKPIQRLRLMSEEDFPDGFIKTIRGLDEKEFNENNAMTEITIFEDHINNDPKLNTFDRKIIIGLIKEVIHVKDIDTELNSNFFNSFIFPEKFGNYFKLALAENEITSNEFEQFRNLPFEKYSAKVDEWLSQNKYISLIDKLTGISRFASKNEFENHLKILWKLGSKYYQFGDSTKFPIFVVYRAIQKSKAFAHLFRGDELYQFLKSLLTKEVENIFFAVEVIFMLIFDSELISIPKSELQEFNFEYLELASKNGRLDDLVTHIYLRCILYDPSNITKDYTMNPKAKEFFIKHFKTNLNSCQLGLFIKESIPGSLKFILNVEEITFYFANYNEFMEYLKDAQNIDKKNNCYLEFEKFLQELNFESEKNTPVFFEFRFLKPRIWIQ